MDITKKFSSESFKNSNRRRGEWEVQKNNPDINPNIFVQFDKIDISDV